MRVVGLFRVSTELQATEGTSLDAQQRAFREMCAQRGWTIVEEFKGHESATQAASDRRVLQQVLACIRERDVDGVWVIEQSRLTRGDDLEAALLMRELKERRIKIIVNGVIRDMASIDERFMVAIQSLVDRAESERIKERMGRGKRERAKQGKKSSGPAPYGYRNPRPGEVGRGTLQVVPEQAMVVQKIFEKYVGGLGSRAIASYLNDIGVPAAKGGKWGKSSVDKVITNPACLGTSMSGVWLDRERRRSFKFEPNNPNAIIVPNAHQPIIDQASWDAARARQKPPCTKTPRMLTKILWVNGMQYHGDSAHTRTFYRAVRGSTGQPWLDCPIVDDAVWEKFTLLATTPEFVDRLLREGQDPRQQERVRQEIEWLTDQIAKHERRLQRLVQMRADDEIDKAQFVKLSDETRAAINQSRRELAEQRSKAVTFDSTHSVRVVRAVQMLIGGRTHLSIDQKRRILGSIVRRVDVTAVPTGATYNRNALGHIQTGANPRWGIERIAFVLALPPADALGGPEGPGGGVGANGANVEQTAGTLVDPREYAANRCGQLVTASSCSVLPEPARR